MCCCSRTVYPALDSPAIGGKYDQWMLLSECAVGRLTRVFARRTRRFVKPRDCRRYIRLAKAQIRLLMCRLSVWADPSLRTSFIVGFAMYRSMRDLFVQTITPNTLGKIFNWRHFETFSHSSKKTGFAFHANCLHCMTVKPCFLGNKKKKKKKKDFFFFLSSAELAQIMVIRYPRAPSVIT